MFKYLLHTKIKKMKSVYLFFSLLWTSNSVRFYKTKHVVDYTDFERIGKIYYHKKKDILSYNYLYAIIFLYERVHGGGVVNILPPIYPTWGKWVELSIFLIFNLFLFRIISKYSKQIAEGISFDSLA